MSLFFFFFNESMDVHRCLKVHERLPLPNRTSTASLKRCKTTENLQVIHSSKRVTVYRKTWATERGLYRTKRAASSSQPAVVTRIVHVGRGGEGGLGSRVSAGLMAF